jgi:hypothetical protein
MELHVMIDREARSLYLQEKAVGHIYLPSFQLIIKSHLTQIVACPYAPQALEGLGDHYYSNVSIPFLI